MNYQLNFAAVWRDFDTLLVGLGLGLQLALVSVSYTHLTLPTIYSV